MKKIFLLSAVFLILAVLTFVYLRQVPAEEGSLIGADREFAVPAQKIQKIFLANRIDGTTTLLERQGADWVYNEKYKARANAVENLLRAVTDIQMMYKPADAAVPNMLNDLATRGIKVEVYGEAEQPLKVYYIGGSPADERGTYAILEDAEQPYVTHIPGWEGNLRFRYNLKGDDWRDRSIFSVRESDIESLSIEYPKQRQHSFRLERQGNAYNINPFYPLQEKVEGVANRSRITAFLDGFEQLGAETFRNDHPGQDSIRQLIPFCTIQLKKTNGEEQVVRLFPIFPDNVVYDAKLNQYQVNAPTEVERYFVDINGEDFLLAQHRVIKDILWAYRSFY